MTSPQPESLIPEVVALYKDLKISVEERVLTALRSLDEQWEQDHVYDRHDWCSRFKHPDGRGLFVYFGDRRGRLVFSGYWPPEHTPDKPPKISVLLDAPADRIARELRLRFFPRYERLFAMVREEKEHAEQREQQRLANAARLREALPPRCDNFWINLDTECQPFRLTISSCDPSILEAVLLMLRQLGLRIVTDSSAATRTL
jgi:hypothetical protein